MSSELTLPSKGVLSLVDPKIAGAIEAALAENDLSKLTTPMRIAYYNAVCESVGLNPLTQPFAFITLEGKLTLYARKECSEQLRKKNTVSTQILRKERVGDYFEVDVRATDRTGRIEEDTSVVYLKDKYGKPLEGSNYANAVMKTVTKGKRRVTLAISGLGLIDESELDTVANVKHSLADNPQIPHPLKEVREHLEARQAEESQIPEALNDEELPTLESLGEYVCKVGKKYVGKRIADIDIFELDSYLKWIEKSARDQNKEINGDWLEFYNNAEAYLVMNERKNLE